MLNTCINRNVFSMDFHDLQKKETTNSIFYTVPYLIKNGFA